MMKYFRTLSLIAVLFTGSLFAHIHPCPGGWAVDAEFLYLLPSVDDTFFVIRSSSAINPIGTKEDNDFDFQAAFRVGAVYAFCDCECQKELQVYYTRLREDQDRTITGTIFGTQGPADFVSDFDGVNGQARSDLDLLYHRVDAFYAQQVYCCCDLNIYLQAGLEWAYIRFREDIEYRNFGPPTPVFAVGNLHQRAKTWGIGPQMGIDAHYNLCEFTCWCCPGNLSLVTWASASILASKTEFEADTIENPGLLRELDVDDHRIWRLVPAFHARVGLNYQTCICCVNASLEVGYEFNTYLRALKREHFVDDVADGLSFANFHNFDLHGLYVAVAVAF